MTAHISAQHDIIGLPLTVKAAGAPGEFEGYGAVFGNIDRDGDVVVKGAFADSLKTQLPALLWQHNPKEPIGRFDVVREDEKGLFVKGRLSGTGKGAEAYELLKMGALSGLSIGFVTREAQRNSASGTRNILRADLMEVSLVTFPANELARVQTVKQKEPLLSQQADIHDPRSFERFLRENGFSRNRAKAITAKGFRSDIKTLDDGELSHLVDILEHRTELLTQKALPALAAPLLIDLAIGTVAGIIGAFTIRGIDSRERKALIRRAENLVIAYEANGRRGRNQHVVRLSKGQSVKLQFRPHHRNGHRKLNITSAGGQKFIGKLHYARWLNGSVTVPYKEIIHNGLSGDQFNASIEVGPSNNIASWIESVSESGLIRAERIIENQQLPYLELKYIGASGSEGTGKAEFLVRLN